MRTINEQEVKTIQEARDLIVGDEGSFVSLGLYHPSSGDFTIKISRGTGKIAKEEPSPKPKPANANATAPIDYNTWSVKDLKLALAESGVNHSWATEKSDLVSLAAENKVQPPGTRRSNFGSSPNGSGFKPKFGGRFCPDSMYVTSFFFK